MTREEMIRKVCEFTAYDCYGYEGEMGFLFCLSCNADPIKDSLYGKDLVHEPDCPVILARKLLSEPVIEVGDVVETMDGRKDVVSQTNLVSIYGELDPYHIDNLTLVRKGAKP